MLLVLYLYEIFLWTNCRNYYSWPFVIFAAGHTLRAKVKSVLHGSTNAIYIGLNNNSLETWMCLCCVYCVLSFTIFYTAKGKELWDFFCQFQQIQDKLVPEKQYMNSMNKVISENAHRRQATIFIIFVLRIGLLAISPKK